MLVAVSMRCRGLSAHAVLAMKTKGLPGRSGMLVNGPAGRLLVVERPGDRVRGRLKMSSPSTGPAVPEVRP